MANRFYSKFVEFLKSHNLYEEQAFRYIWKNALYIDYLNEEVRDFIGCFFIYENGYLTKIRLCVPYIVDDKTVLINIHEYVHAFLLYYKLNTKYKIGIEKEVLPLFFEKLYILENPGRGLEEYERYLNQFIIKENILEYKLALDVVDDLVQLYKPEMSIQKLEKKTKRLVKRRN